MHHLIATLSGLFQEIAQAPTAVSIMHTTVNRISETLNVPVCSLYLRSKTKDTLILAATHGLAPESVGKVSLSLNEGLVGAIASSLHPMNLGDAPTHDKFVYIPETHEAPYHQFLGVPLIHLRKLIGVLVVQGTETEPFGLNEEIFLTTIASQLAGTLAPIQKSGEWLRQGTRRTYFRRHTGISGAPGIACGRIHALDTGHTWENVPTHRIEDVDFELGVFDHALEAVREELEQGSKGMSGQLPEDVAGLFTVYRMMLDGPELQGGIRQRIREGDNAEWAVKQTATELAKVFEKADDPYLKARGEDIRNLGMRLISNLSICEVFTEVAEDSEIILAGHLISITDLSRVPANVVKGLLCTEGAALSHTAIVARALGIPAVMGVKNFDLSVQNGQLVVLDGYRGECISTPPPALIAEYRRIQNQEAELMKGLEKLRDLPAVTQDGFRVQLLTNTGLLADVTPGLARGAEGVGLYRSEMPFMIHEGFPTEEEQFEAYRQVLEAYKPRPVSMRTLDIGGDKQLPYFEINETNPFLGWRGIRFSLDNTPLLMTQLRAMLRADVSNGNLKLLVPMVGRVDEMMMVRQLVNQACEQLQAEGVAARVPELGMMVEVPSAVLLLHKLKPYIDFVSVGSNDLTQYLLAIDRNNPRVSELFDNLHPAMLIALQEIVHRCHALDLPVSLCGEMAADPLGVMVLVAMGYDTLSLSAYNIPKIKQLIRATNRSDLQQLLEQAMEMNQESEVRALLKQAWSNLEIKKPD